MAGPRVWWGIELHPAGTVSSGALGLGTGAGCVQYLDEEIEGTPR